MELVSWPMRRYWRRNRYQRINGGNRKNKMKVIRIGDHGSPRRAWKLKAARLRMLKIARSPLKLLGKIKSAYVNMMLNLAGNDSVFGNRRIPKARQPSVSYYSQAEFEARLVYEIYMAFKQTQ